MTDIRDDILNAIRGGATTAAEIRDALGLDPSSYRVDDWLGHLEYDRVVTSHLDDRTVRHYAIAR
jgi:hypothetical protein